MKHFNSAVLLDRDGVLNKLKGYITKPEELEFEEGAVEAVKTFNKLGLEVVVITNQPQIARGLVSEAGVKAINDKLSQMFREQGARIDAFYYCPHHPEAHHKDIPPELMRYRIKCECRKPGVGLIMQAVSDFDVDLKTSFVIGDSTHDIKAGRDAGCRTVLVATGEGGLDRRCDVTADFKAKNIGEAARLIEKIVSMKAVILAGGRGERLRPLTDTIPKPMVLVAGKPILEHLVGLNVRSGIRKIIIPGHYKFQVIKDYFGSGERFGAEIEYIDDGDEPLGSGGALYNCRELLPENFVVMNGDKITNFNIFELVRLHFMKYGLATIVVRKTDHPHDSDLIEMGEDGRAVKFASKNDPNKKGEISNSGLFVFKKEAMKYVSERSNVEQDMLRGMIENGESVSCYLNTDYYIKDIGTKERYEKAQAEVQKLIEEGRWIGL